MKISVLIIFLFSAACLKAQGYSCNLAKPACTGSGYSFQLNVCTTAETGPDYACLCTQPNPSWFYFLIDQPGNLEISIQTTNGIDVDYVAWGPFDTLTTPCSSMLFSNCTGCSGSGCPSNNIDPNFYPSGNVIDCAYGPSQNEYLHINGAHSGKYYIICITNFTNQHGEVSFTQTNTGDENAGSINCNPVSLVFNSLTASNSTCNPVNNNYSVSGQLTFTGAPNSGTLEINDSPSNVSLTYTAPFTSPVNYTISNLLSSYTTHTITAKFSDSPNTNISKTYYSPPPCNSCFANAGPDITVCGLTATLNATEYPSDLNNIWQMNTIVSFNDATSPVTQVTSTFYGTYALVWQVTNQSGNVCRDTMKIKFLPVPTSSFTMDHEICAGNPSFVSYNGTGGNEFYWDFGTGASPSQGFNQGPFNVYYNSPGTYNVSLITVSEDNCSSSISTQTITVYSIPPSDFLTEGSVCEASLSSITAGFADDPDYTYNWTITGSTPSTSTSYGPINVIWPSAMTSEVMLHVTNSITGCTSSQTNYVTVVPIGTPNCCINPLPYAGSDEPEICGLKYTLNATPQINGNVAYWTLISGPGTCTFSDSSLYNSELFVSTEGTYVFQWNAQSGTCTNFDQVTITFIEQPNANISDDRIQICLNSTSLSANNSVSGSSLLWSVVAPMSATFSPNNNSNNVSVSLTSGDGIYFIVLTESVSLTCNSTDTVRVENLSTPVTYAGADAFGCGVNYNLNADATWPGYWSSSITGVVYYPNQSDPHAVARIPNYVTPTYNVTFTWHAVNGICEGTDAVTITFQKPPHMEAGSSQSVCGYQTSLNADTIGAGLTSAYWHCNIPSIVITPDHPGPIPATATVDASAAAGLFLYSNLPVYFYWTGTNSMGCTSSDSTLITFYEIPDAFSGSDDSVCGKTYDLIGQFSLDNSTGSWTILTKPNSTSTANFLPANTPFSDVTVSDYGIYQFIWTERNAWNMTCSDKDTIQISFMTIPMPYSGQDQSVCGNYVLLHTDTTYGSAGYWQSILNTWYDASVWPNDTVACPSCSSNVDVVAYFPTVNDTVVYYWIAFNGLCYGYDSTNVFFNSIEQAISLVDPADTSTCGQIFTNLNAQIPAYGTGYWYDTVALSQFYPNNFTATPDSVVIASNTWGWHNFYWVTVNGNCRDTSDVAPVWFGGLGGAKGHISGLNGNTDFTVGLYVSGSPNPYGTGTPDQNGNYFVQSNAGQFYLKVGNDNPTINTGIASTYYVDAWNWSEALTVNVPVCDTITKDITMYTFPLASGGLCDVFGTVMYDNGGPVENANVYLLYKPVNTPAILELTNSSGYYSLNNIPNGNYKIQVDIPGLPQVTTHHITVNSNDTLFPDVNFIVDTINISKEYGYGIYADSNFVYGIGEPLSAKHPVHIYPVPFSNELFMESYNDGNITIEWYSQDGRMISVSEMKYVKGTNRIQVPEDLNKGIYYLKVTKENTVYIKKLIKE